MGIRCWLSEISGDSNRISVSCDIVTLPANQNPTEAKLKFHGRGSGQFVAVDSPLLTALPSAGHLYDRPHLLTFMSETYEELWGLLILHTAAVLLDARRD